MIVLPGCTGDFYDEWDSRVAACPSSVLVSCAPPAFPRTPLPLLCPRLHSESRKLKPPRCSFSPPPSLPGSTFLPTSPYALPGSKHKTSFVCPCCFPPGDMVGKPHLLLFIALLLLPPSRGFLLRKDPSLIHHHPKYPTLGRLSSLGVRSEWRGEEEALPLAKEVVEEAHRQLQEAFAEVDAQTQARLKRILQTYRKHQVRAEEYREMRRMVRGQTQSRSPTPPPSTDPGARMVHHQVGTHLFNGIDGYGHGDLGRDVLEEVYADLFGAEAALVRVQVFSGTHAISCALYGVLRPG